MKKQQGVPSRILGRKVGRVISPEEMHVVSGGDLAEDTAGDGEYGNYGGSDRDGSGGGGGAGFPGDTPSPFSDFGDRPTGYRGTMTIEPGPYGATTWDEYYQD